MKFLFVNGRTRILPLLGLLLVFGGLIFALLWFMVLPGKRGLLRTASSHTGIHVVIRRDPQTGETAASFILPAGTAVDAPASIIEETLTPIPLETVTPLPTVTETPGQMSMEILSDTRHTVYVAPTETCLCPIVLHLWRLEVHPRGHIRTAHVRLRRGCPCL